MSTKEEIIRQIKFRIYTRLLHRYSERTLIRHLNRPGERLLRAVNARAARGRSG